MPPTSCIVEIARAADKASRRRPHGPHHASIPHTRHDRKGPTGRRPVDPWPITYHVLARARNFAPDRSRVRIMSELARPFVSAWQWVGQVGGFPGQVFAVV